MQHILPLHVDLTGNRKAICKSRAWRRSCMLVLVLFFKSNQRNYDIRLSKLLPGLDAQIVGFQVIYRSVSNEFLDKSGKPWRWSVPLRGTDAGLDLSSGSSVVRLCNSFGDSQLHWNPSTVEPSWLATTSIRYCKSWQGILKPSQDMRQTHTVFVPSTAAHEHMDLQRFIPQQMRFCWL